MNTSVLSLGSLVLEKNERTGYHDPQFMLKFKALTYQDVRHVQIGARIYLAIAPLHPYGGVVGLTRVRVINRIYVPGGAVEIHFHAGNWCSRKVVNPEECSGIYRALSESVIKRFMKRNPLAGMVSVYTELTV